MRLKGKEGTLHGGTKGKGKRVRRGMAAVAANGVDISIKKGFNVEDIGLGCTKSVKTGKVENRGCRKYDRGRIRCVKEPFDGTGLMKDMLG